MYIKHVKIYLNYGVVEEIKFKNGIVLFPEFKDLHLFIFSWEKIRYVQRNLESFKF